MDAETKYCDVCGDLMTPPRRSAVRLDGNVRLNGQELTLHYDLCCPACYAALWQQLLPKPAASGQRMVWDGRQYSLAPA